MPGGTLSDIVGDSSASTEPHCPGWKIPRKQYELILSLLRITTWPRQQRRHVPGYGTCLGCTYGGPSPFIGPYTKRCEQLIRVVNNMVYRETRRFISDSDRPTSIKRFYWSSVQINFNTISAKHTDSNNLGLSYIFTLGDFTGGEVVVPYMNVVNNCKGVATCFDGKRLHWSQAYEGERFSIVVFCHDRHSLLAPET